MSHPSPHLPDASAWLAWWTWDPLVLAGLATGAALYTVGAVRLRRAAGAGRGIAPRRAAAFGAGLAVVALALVSPVDRASDILFSAHMVQHELLMLVAAPLVVLGRPLVPLLWVCPRALRVRLRRTSEPARVWRVVSHPVVALGLHAVTRLIWHVPALFDAALADERLHVIQHLTFFATAVVFWWALIYGRYGRYGYGIGVVFVFVTMLYSGLLGAMLSLAGHPLYAHAGPSARWGVDPLVDQQRAGLVMWVPAGVIMMVIGLAIFAAWLGQSAVRAGHARFPGLVGSDRRSTPPRQDPGA